MAGPSEPSGVSHYLWNVALSESLYISLHYFEVCLRNNINNFLSLKYARNDWYNMGWLATNEQLKITECEASLAKEGKTVTASRIIAGLSLGFWIKLFSRQYERELWQKNDPLKTVFPNIPSGLKHTRNIASRLERVRELRNRVSHHERICHMPLSERYSEMRDVVSWLNRNALHVVDNSCKFKNVFDSGHTAFEVFLKKDDPPPTPVPLLPQEEGSCDTTKSEQNP